MGFNGLLEKFVGWQYPFLMVASFLLAFLFGQTEAIPISIISWYGLLYSIYLLLKKDINKDLKTWMLVIISYILLTIIGYSYNGVPIKAYYVDSRAFLNPMLFVFVGAVNADKKVYFWYLLAVGFCMIVGLYLYVVQPSWYISYKTSILSSAWYSHANLNEDNLMIISNRFSSFFVNIYPAAYFGVFAYCIIVNDLYKKTEVRLIKNRILQIILLLVIVVGVMYTMVRVAFVYIIILTVFYLFYGHKTHNSSNNIVFGILVIAAGILFGLAIEIAGTSNGSDTIELVSERLSAVSYDDMMRGSRTRQNEIALNAWQNVLTGDGLGSRGGYARGQGLPGITDGGWTKFLVEYGILGVFLFISFIIVTFKRAFKSLRCYIAELSIFAYGLISMIGADTLSKGWMITIMWIAVGRIWNRRYLNKMVKTKDYV